MSRNQKKSDICLNCNNPLRPDDNFCPICGQENNISKISVHHLVVSVFEDFFNFDTKLLNTIKASFTKPGKITLDYLDGKRIRYVPPVKFYVFVSFIFFLLLGKIGDEVIDSSNKSNKEGVKSMNPTLKESQARGIHHGKGSNDLSKIEFDFTSKDSLKKDLEQLKNAPDSVINKMLIEEDIDTTAENINGIHRMLTLIPEQNNVSDSTKPRYCIYGKVEFSTKKEYDQFKENIYNYTNEEVDSLLMSKGEKANWFNRQMLKKQGKLNWKNKDNIKEITHAIIKSISLTVFIMMPIMALLLQLIFYRKKYYYEHLIFSIHIHTIFFIILSLVFAIQIYINESFGDNLLPWSFLLCLIYLILSLKHNYKQSWGKTIAKFTLMSIPYFFISLILTLLAVIYGYLS